MRALRTPIIRRMIGTVHKQALAEIATTLAYLALIAAFVLWPLWVSCAILALSFGGIVWAGVACGRRPRRKTARTQEVV